MGRAKQDEAIVALQDAFTHHEYKQEKTNDDVALAQMKLDMVETESLKHMAQLERTMELATKYLWEKLIVLKITVEANMAVHVDMGGSDDCGTDEAPSERGAVSNAVLREEESSESESESRSSSTDSQHETGNAASMEDESSESERVSRSSSIDMDELMGLVKTMTLKTYTFVHKESREPPKRATRADPQTRTKPFMVGKRRNQQCRLWYKVMGTLKDMQERITTNFENVQKRFLQMQDQLDGTTDASIQAFHGVAKDVDWMKETLAIVTAGPSVPR